MNYDLEKIEYKITGEGQPLLLLHGWGGSLESLVPIASKLQGKYKIIAFSLPGFGASPEPEDAWSVQDYADLVEAFLAKVCTPEERERLFVISHSYGGRLTAKIKRFAKIVFVASAGIKPKRSLGYHVSLGFYKFVKFLSEIPLLGVLFRRQRAALLRQRSSDDYKNASDNMKQALVLAVNHDQQHDFAQITAPTLLIWGVDDDVTPIEGGRLIERLVKGSALVEVKNATHYIYREKPGEVAAIVDEFFKPENELPVIEDAIHDDKENVENEKSKSSDKAEVN